MARIRVLRILEYVYEDYETMEADMGRWQIPATGHRHFGLKETIRSAIIANPIDENLGVESQT